MRPRSMMLFEVTALLSVAAGVLVVLLGRQEIAEAIAAQRLKADFVWASYVAVFLLMIVLVLLASRKASAVAKWLAALLMTAGILLAAPRIPEMFGQGLVGMMELAQIVLGAAALYFLFSGDSRRWFSERRATPATPS